MKTTIGRSTAIALAATALLALGACDSGSTTDAAPASTVAWNRTEGGTWDASVVEVGPDDLDCAGPAPQPTRGVTDASIRVGGLGTVSGPTVATYPDTDAGARARFERANAQGGVHGRTIDYRGMEDDGFDPTRQVDAARRLVADEVFLAAPVMTALPNFRQTFCDAVLPHFGWGFNSGWCDTAVGFPITGCLVRAESPYLAMSSSSVDDLMPDRPRTVALLGNEEEAAQLGNRALRDAFETSGYRVVYAENPLSGRSPITDASPIVNDIMTADEGAPPTFVYLVADFANTNTMVQALDASGYDGTIISAVGYDPRLAGAAQFEGVHTTLQWAPFEATDVPFVDQMSEDLDRYAPDAAKGLPAAAGYIAADMVVAALDAAGRDLTTDRLVNTLNAGWTYRTPSFRGDAVFPANHVMPVPCGTLVVLDGGAFRSIGGLVCADPVLR